MHKWEIFWSWMWATSITCRNQCEKYLQPAPKVTETSSCPRHTNPDLKMDSDKNSQKPCQMKEGTKTCIFASCSMLKFARMEEIQAVKVLVNRLYIYRFVSVCISLAFAAWIGIQKSSLQFPCTCMALCISDLYMPCIFKFAYAYNFPCMCGPHLLYVNLHLVLHMKIYKQKIHTKCLYLGGPHHFYLLLWICKHTSRGPQNAY